MGYGLFNALAATQLMADDAASGNFQTDLGAKPFVKEIRLDPATMIDFTATPNGTGALQVTICWTDPPGTAQTNGSLDPQDVRLVNDLDLRIYPPGAPLIKDGAATLRPWVLNPDLTNRTAAARGAAATRGDDTRNNVEQVVAYSPTANQVYRVRVDHKGTLQNSSPQWVSVVISGNAIPYVDFRVTAFQQTVPATSPPTYMIVFNSVPGGIYRLESSNDLVTWVTASGDIVARADQTTTTVQSGQSQQFYRFRRYY
jgi:hypothetical protein